MNKITSVLNKRLKTTKATQVIFFSIFLWILLISVKKDYVSTSGLILVFAIYLLCLFPSYLHFKKNEKIIPVFPLYTIIYFIYYGYPIFAYSDITTEVDPLHLNKALMLTLLGLLSMYLGFYSFLGKACSIFPQLKIEWNSKKALHFGIWAGLIGLFLRYCIVSSGVQIELSGIFKFFSELSMLAIVMLFMLQLQEKLRFGGRIFLWGLLVPSRFALVLVEAATYGIFIDLTVILLVYIYQRRRISWTPLVVSAMLFFIIFSVRDEYRFMISGKGAYGKGKTTAQKVLLYMELAKNKLTGKRNEFFDTYQKLSKRTDALSVFAEVVYLTPDSIPYWNGYTYKTLTYSFLPRVIFENKPIETIGNEFGHRYGFLHYTDTSTSFNLPQLIEMYINFGPIGVIIGMFLFGLLFRSIYTILNHLNAGEGGTAICLVISRILLNMEANFSVVFGSLFQHIILFYFLLKLINSPRINVSHQSQK